MTGTGIVDQRLKPQSLRRHRKSEFEQYLPRHIKNSPNTNVAPYPIDEKGRLKKTQVLDHIIKMKRDVNRKNDNIKEHNKKKNEETFVNYLLEKKQQEKVEKRKLRLM